MPPPTTRRGERFADGISGNHRIMQHPLHPLSVRRCHHRLCRETPLPSQLVISHEGYLGARRMDVSRAAVEGFHGRDEHAGSQQENKEASSHRSDDRKQNKQTICCLYLRARSAYRVQKVLLRGTWMHHSREDGQGHHGARRTDTTRRRRMEQQKLSLFFLRPSVSQTDRYARG